MKLRDFRLNPEHPPLVKLWVGAALASGFHLPPLPRLVDKFAEREFNESVVFLDNDPDRVQTRSRAAMWALNGLLMLFLALSVSRAPGNTVALGTVPGHRPNGGWPPSGCAHRSSSCAAGDDGHLFAVQAFRSGRWFDVSLAALALGLTLGAKHSGLIALVTVGTSGAAVALLPRITARTMSRASVLVLTFTILLGALVVLWGLRWARFFAANL